MAPLAVRSDQLTLDAILGFWEAGVKKLATAASVDQCGQQGLSGSIRLQLHVLVKLLDTFALARLVGGGEMDGSLPADLLAGNIFPDSLTGFAMVLNFLTASMGIEAGLSARKWHSLFAARGIKHCWMLIGMRLLLELDTV